MNTCCFTGHRKIYLPDKEVRARIAEAVKGAVTKQGYTHFIAGGAIGFDTLAAEVILELKKEYDITLEIAIPFPAQALSYSIFQKHSYDRILLLADKQTIVSPMYHQSCYERRNRYMVDNSALVIAFFDGSKGGTKNTVDYAAKKNIKVINIYN